MIVLTLNQRLKYITAAAVRTNNFAANPIVAALYKRFVIAYDNNEFLEATRLAGRMGF